jgi:peptidoglycan/xylan/chitin deacetylase (PgdA/CDA1 family)
VRAILTYHSIDTTGSVISVSPDVFDRQIRWIASSQVAVVSLPELLHLPDDRDAVAITFDDAYTNFASAAWPRLREHGLTATVFVPTAFTGKANTWPELPGGRMPRLPILGWPELARLSEEGVSLGAHTRHHPDLRALSGQALEEEIAGSVDDVRRQTGTEARAFAYPYGFWTPAAAAMVRRWCVCAVTTELRPLGRHDDPHALPRLDSYYLNGTGRIENFGRVSFREYLRIRLALRTLRQRMRARRPV